MLRYSRTSRPVPFVQSHIFRCLLSVPVHLHFVLPMDRLCSLEYPNPEAFCCCQAGDGPPWLLRLRSCRTPACRGDGRGSADLVCSAEQQFRRKREPTCGRSRREVARYGLRARRIGEASNPGPDYDGDAAYTEEQRDRVIQVGRSARTAARTALRLALEQANSGSSNICHRIEQ